jgi:hypothetical protein
MTANGDEANPLSADAIAQRVTALSTGLNADYIDAVRVIGRSHASSSHSPPHHAAWL